MFRLVDEWFISMGPVYDQPRETLTAEQVDASLRYQIMEVVDQIRWIPGFGYERELDWLLNMHDWMISKKRYWGLALPIYDCCGVRDRSTSSADARSSRERAVEGWDRFEGHTPAPPVRRRGHDRLPGCGGAGRADPGRRQSVAGRRDRAVLDAPLPRGPGLLGAVVPGRLHHRELPGPVPQLVLLDARDVAPSSAASRRSRRSSATRTLFGEDGRPMHKSWGNAIEFDEAAERMGVDVMRWMFAKARPEDNILFGWHAADEARRELLVLWNVYAFFVTYARLAGWDAAATSGGDQRPSERPVLDRWILSRAAGRRRPLVERSPGATTTRSAPRGRSRTFIDDLSTWYLRLSRDRILAAGDAADRDAAFATLHAALVSPGPHRSRRSCRS